MLEYIGTAGIAEITGLSQSTVAAYVSKGKLPIADAIIKGSGVETKGWLPETIERWHRERSNVKIGRKPYVRWVENTEDNTVIILTKTVAIKDLAAWLAKSCDHPNITARDILENKNTRLLPRKNRLISAKHLFAIDPDLTLQDARTRAHSLGVTCGDADLVQVATVLENTHLEEYFDLVRSCKQKRRETARNAMIGKEEEK